MPTNAWRDTKRRVIRFSRHDTALDVDAPHCTYSDGYILIAAGQDIAFGR